LKSEESDNNHQHRPNQGMLGALMALGGGTKPRMTFIFSQKQGFVQLLGDHLDLQSVK
jgi:hypothetical protein